MNCAYSKEILALYVEDDLSAPDAQAKVDSHVATCAAGRQYCEQLRRTQAFLKARFRPPQPEPISQQILADVRRSVMSHIAAAQRTPGWILRLERVLMLGFRRH